MDEDDWPSPPKSCSPPIAAAPSSEALSEAPLSPHWDETPVSPSDNPLVAAPTEQAPAPPPPPPVLPVLPESSAQLWEPLPQPKRSSTRDPSPRHPICDRPVCLAPTRQPCNPESSPDHLTFGSKPQAPYRDAFRRHVKRRCARSYRTPCCLPHAKCRLHCLYRPASTCIRPGVPPLLAPPVAPLARSPVLKRVATADRSSFAHTHVENAPLQNAAAHASSENEGFGLTTAAPVMRNRAWEIGVVPAPLAWESPVMLHTENLAQALGLDWSKYHERMLGRSTPPSEAAVDADLDTESDAVAPRPPPAALSMAVTSQMSKLGHAHGMGARAGASAAHGTVEGEGEIEGGGWISIEGEEPPEPPPPPKTAERPRSPAMPRRGGSPPAPAGPGPGASPHRAAPPPSGHKKDVVITRDGRKVDVGMFNDGQAGLLARVQVCACRRYGIMHDAMARIRSVLASCHTARHCLPAPH